MSDDKYRAYQPTGSETLEKLVMDPNIPKSETEGWACREIARLRADRRERIATAFMAAILCREENNDVGYLNPKLVPKDALRYADALIGEIDKEAKP